MYTVAGTQAENTLDNHIVVSKMYSLFKTQYDDDPDEAEPENYEEDAKIAFDTIPHRGAVNRIRVEMIFLIECSAFQIVRRLSVHGQIRVL